MVDKDTLARETEAREHEQERESGETEQSTAAVPEIGEEELKVLCREQVCPDCPVGIESREARLRALADAENLKKRLIREKEEFCKFANEQVLEDLLPVLDNLDLALQHGQGNEACKDFVAGVDMTRKIFLDTLSRHGLVPVGEVGEDFDPAVHEAVGQQEHPEFEKGKVCEMMKRGYVLKGRLLRPAMVVVSKGC